jgi:thymidine kinase
MFSGKTSELLRRLAEYPRGKALAFKHAIDTRYSASTIVSHGGKASPAIVVANASEIERHVSDDIELAAIDEAHFFDEGLADIVVRLAERGIDVVLTSLQPDSWGRPFLVAERLLAIADEPIVTTATCARCGALADRTQRLTPIIDGQMVVEPSNYEPRCRTCWRPPPEPQ